MSWQASLALKAIVTKASEKIFDHLNYGDFVTYLGLFIDYLSYYELKRSKNTLMKVDNLSLSVRIVSTSITPF